MPAEPSRAVFLSYASQDTEAARRICEALQSAGVEVWLDQSELRGGDAWDQKIRRQIKECTLFLPLISANTDARPEGYFRLEWKLAVDRSHLMSDDHPFLFPVVIDDTADATARVPDKFRAVQWTRLDFKDTPESLARRVAGLLGGERAPAVIGAPATTRPRESFSGAWWGKLGAIGGVAIAFVYALQPLWKSIRRGEARPAGKASHAPAVQAPSEAGLTSTDKSAGSVSKPDHKSVAVLAFANLADDKANEYFSDGIAEELLTMLQKIPGLRVAARTSAWSFKGKNSTAKEVGEKLGVAHVVEGSVQKAGNRVRITARLCRAVTNEEVWSKSFGPQELTDVFAIQGEIAQAIVAELRGRLAGEAAALAKAEIQAQVQAATKGGTKDAEAHRLYLQGRYFAERFAPDDLERAVAYFQQAVARDASYALGWAGLARAQLLLSQQGILRFQEASDAAERAMSLEPELAEAHAALSKIRLLRDWDFRAAEEFSQRALALAPGDAVIVSNAANLATEFGRAESAIALARRAVQLDPVNLSSHRSLAYAYFVAERYGEAEAQGRRMVELDPSLPSGYRVLFNFALLKGRLDEAAALLERERAERFRLYHLALLRDAQGRRADADAVIAEIVEKYASELGLQVAIIYARRGDADRAFEWLERALRDRDTGLVGIKSTPQLRALRADPRWPEFLKKVGLSDEQFK